MLGHRELNLDEYLQIARRRMWWIIVPALIGPVIAYGISLRLPNRYTSQTLVLVEHQKVPDAYVQPVVTEVLNARLATMQEQILSRSRLQPVIERFGLYRDVPKATMEQKVDLMRKAVAVRPVRGDFGYGGGGLPGFYIAFTTSNPRLAQQVCGEITSMFMAENLKLREQSAVGTTDFIKTQLVEAKRSLDEQDRKLATFKQRYVGQLPGQEQTNFAMLTSLNSQLDAVTQSINRLQQDKTYAETMVSQELEAWRRLQAAQGSQSVSPDTLDQQLAASEAQLTTLQTRYTSTHPDVLKLKRHIAWIKKRIAEFDAAEGSAKNKKAATDTIGDPSAKEPSHIKQLRAQLRGMERSLSEQQAAQAKIVKQINLYQGRVQLSPVVEEEYKQITRDYGMALDFYNQLLNKRNQSEMATDLERRQQGEQFRVLDSPNLPENPTFPNRPMFAAGGFGGGIGLGLAIALLLEFRDKAIRTEKDVQFYLELPTLMLMPSVDIDPAQRREGGWRQRWSKKDRQRQQVGA
jgi:protein tyrosine kinase modulator